jgi:hypothetical protein
MERTWTVVYVHVHVRGTHTYEHEHEHVKCESYLTLTFKTDMDWWSFLGLVVSRIGRF